MQQRLSLVTLGVADLDRARAFYEALGWKPSPASQPSIVFYQLNGLALALWSRAALAEDAGVPDAPTGFSAITLAHNCRSEAEVDAVMVKALAAGARLLRAPSKAFWGGYTAYFADPDGHVWEVAYNPFFPLDERGNLSLGGAGPNVSTAPIEIPRWADALLVPALAVTTAFVAAGLVVAAIGENPLSATRSLVVGALGSREGIGFTLYYATSFIFAGLAVALAYHAGLFNIGGEGQATVGGIGLGLACLALERWPGFLQMPLAVMAAMAGGALWGFVPGWLQARRGSHVVITTIMFNFLAATLLVYLLVNVIGRPDSMAPETRNFSEAARLSSMRDLLRPLGLDLPTTPLNTAFLMALVAALGVWLLVYRSRLGFALRTVGANPNAASYAGISPARVIIVAMTLSGALAGLLAVNELLGVQHRLIMEFSGGYGFVGIAVALMGRAHPVGVLLASLLFGVLYQGGTELSFDQPKITRDMIVVIGGIVILFAGALDGLFRRVVARLVAGRG